MSKLTRSPEPPPLERFDDPAGVEGRIEVIQSVINETRALFHALKSAAQRAHGQDSITAGQRGVLVDLARHGPMTVPDLARLRPVSRQHIQGHVNSMLVRGLLEMVENPAHKRSKLVCLTAKGTRLIRNMQDREQKWLDKLQVDASEAELRRAAILLRKLRTAVVYLNT